MEAEDSAVVAVEPQEVEVEADLVEVVVVVEAVPEVASVLEPRSSSNLMRDSRVCTFLEAKMMPSLLRT